MTKNADESYKMWGGIKVMIKYIVDLYIKLYDN